MQIVPEGSDNSYLGPQSNPYAEVLKEYGLSVILPDNSLFEDNGFFTPTEPLILRGNDQAWQFVKDHSPGVDPEESSLPRGCSYLVTKYLIEGGYTRVTMPDGNEIPVIVINRLDGVSYPHEYMHFWIDSINPEMITRSREIKLKLRSQLDEFIPAIQTGELTVEEIEEEFCYSAIHEGIAFTFGNELFFQKADKFMQFIAKALGLKKDSLLNAAAALLSNQVTSYDQAQERTRDIFSSLSTLFNLVQKGNFTLEEIKEIEGQLTTEGKILFDRAKKKTEKQGVEPLQETKDQLAETLIKLLITRTAYPNVVGKSVIETGVDFLMEHGFGMHEALIAIIKNPPKKVEDLLNIEQYLIRTLAEPE